MAGRWNRALAWALAGRGLGGGLLAAGLVVLPGRVAGADVWLPAAVLGAAAGLIWAGWRWRGRRVQASTVATLLDLRLGGRGDLLHALESGVELRPGTPLAQLTRPRPAGRGVARTLVPGALFLWLATLVPLRASASSDLLVEARLTELTDLAAVLEESLVLEEELRQDVAENLDQTRQQSLERELDRAALHEALDGLEQRLQSAADAGAEQLQAIQREVAHHAASVTADPDPALAARALEELGDLAQELGEITELPRGLSVDKLAALSVEELAALLDQAAGDQLARLADRGLLDPRRLASMELRGPPRELKPLSQLPPLKPRACPEGKPCASCEAGGECEDAASACPDGDPCAGCKSGGACSVAGLANGPGRGGVTRGPGAAPLTWGEESPDLGAEMAATALPAPASPEEATLLLGLAAAAPETAPQETLVPAAGAGPGTQGETTFGRRLHPRHRHAVREFFDRAPQATPRDRSP